MESKTLLQNVAYNGEKESIEELFTQHGPQVDEDGRTLLHFVALGTTKNHARYELTNWIEIADFLFEKGADVNAEDNEKNTPFHYSVGGCAPDFVLWLISKGANNSPNKKGETPLLLAETSINNTRFKEDKKKLRRADGTLFISAKDGLLEYIAPKKFHCPDRFSLRTAYMMALLAKVIYKGDGSELGDKIVVSGNEIVHAFIKRWGFKKIKIAEKGDARGMVLEFDAIDDQPKIFVVAFRGTKTKKDVLADITAVKADSGKHYGFDGHLNKISEMLISQLNKHENVPVYITGHSLGGAMSTLMMEKLLSLGFSSENLFMYTFGQPRAGTKEFQLKFDAEFKNAYIVQRHLDPVPLVPTFSGHVVGGYVHSGSLRFLDSAGQLYNDIHYQYEDINRGVMYEIPNAKKSNLAQLRKIWTGGFQQLVQVTVEEESNTSFLDVTDEYSLENDQHNELLNSGSIPQKNSTQKDTNVILNMLKGRKNALAAHGMANYLNDIATLESRVNQPFSWSESPEKAITSQLSSVTLPLDVYDEFIKGKRYLKEQELAYQNWVRYYTNLPGNSYFIDPSLSCGNLIPWIRQDSNVLQQIQEIENAIFIQRPRISKNYIIPKKLHRTDISPLIEVSLYSIIQILSQIMNEDKSLAISYYRWLYWSMPENGFSLREIESNKNIFTLEYISNSNESPYRKAIQNTMIHLSKNLNIKSLAESKDDEFLVDSNFSEILEQMAFSLPSIAKADNGLRIAKLSANIQKAQKEWRKVKQEARMELVQIEYAIIGEMINKLQKIGLKTGVIVAAAAGVGTAAGAAAGLATGVGVTAASVGVGTPVAIAAGVAVGTSVGISTTAAVITAIALKKLPKYLKSLKSSLSEMNKYLMGVASPDLKIREESEKSILKLARKSPSKTTVMLHFLNGLYITLTLVKLENTVPINPQKTWDNKNDHESKQKTDKLPFFLSKIESFFRKVLSLINLYIAVIDFDDDTVNSNLKVLHNILETLEKNPDVYYYVFQKLGNVLEIPSSTVGVEFFTNHLRLKQSMNYLNNLLSEQLKPEGVTTRKRSGRNTSNISPAPSVIISDDSDSPIIRRRSSSTASSWRPANPYLASSGVPNVVVGTSNITVEEKPLQRARSPVVSRRPAQMGTQ